ncbi:hypothetical protein, partial [Limnospira platensis]|uniref:hypothetical protein n=1 Tax=Limnospira platensis TaxID=118562 RepID=UPI00339721B7
WGWKIDSHRGGRVYSYCPRDGKLTAEPAPTIIAEVKKPGFSVRRVRQRDNLSGQRPILWL